MTHLLKLTCTMLATIAPAIAVAQGVAINTNALSPALRHIEPPRLIPIEIPIPDPGPVIAGATPAAAADGTFCGNADVFYWYEEDANGNEIPGTRQYGCTD